MCLTNTFDTISTLAVEKSIRKKVYPHNKLNSYRLPCRTLLCSIFLLIIFVILNSLLWSEIQEFELVFASPTEVEQIRTFQDWNCGINSTVNSNYFIKEIRIPEKCSVPIAIGYDEKDNKVWLVGTRNGTLLEYDPDANNFSSYKIPNWYSRELPAGTSWSWALKFDKTYNNIWFTDEKLDSLWKFNKTNRQFEQYIVPYKSESYSTSYPISLAFPDENNVYFVGIRSLSLWHGSLDGMKSGTSKGIEEIPIPLGDSFKGIPDYEVGLGSLAIDHGNQNIWITALAFDKKGLLVKYNIPDKKFSLYELPDTIKSPTGISIDKDGNLWITDHATSSFYKISPPSNSSMINMNEVEHFVTAPLSSRIIGIKHDDLSNNTVNLYQSSLPYWIKSTEEDNIFTNEHVGNKIAKYSPHNDTLTEYWIPSQNVLYSVCSPQSSTNICGYSNALQFDIQYNTTDNTINKDARIWFSEQSENKIGYVDLGKKIPIDIVVNPSFLNLKNGVNDTVNLNMNVLVNLSLLQQELEYNNTEDKNMSLKPIWSTSFSPNGNLSGFSATFTPNLLNMEYNQSNIDSKQTYANVKVELKINHKINPGNYNLIVGIESKDFSILKKVKIKVSE